MHVRWAEGAAATPHGQLVFLVAFLTSIGVFERWVSQCPLEYRSGNVPDKRDLLGTPMMDICAALRHVRVTAEQFESTDCGRRPRIGPGCRFGLTHRETPEVLYR